MKAFCVLSYSGTIRAESSILRFAAITRRSPIERPEALDAGSIIMTDRRPVSVTAGIEASSADHSATASPEACLVADCSVPVRDFILSTACEHAVWAGLR